MYFGCCDSSCRSNYALHFREGKMKLFGQTQRVEWNNTQFLILGILQIRLQKIAASNQIFFKQVRMVVVDTFGKNYSHREAEVEAYFFEIDPSTLPLDKEKANTQMPHVSAKLIFHLFPEEKGWFPVTLHL